MGNEPPNIDNEVSAHLLEMNAILIKHLIQRIAEVLYQINQSIETQSKIDKKVLGDLEKLREDGFELLQAANTVVPWATEIHVLLKDFLTDKPFHEEDKASFFNFSRSFISAISRWNIKEQEAVLEVFREGPQKLIAVKKRLSKLYYLALIAFITTVLSQAGAPEWIQKLLKMLTG